ncbi:alanine racemase [Ancylobacter sp. VNQ12]|uniref:alanine racemase n=1 Tax=Ancylobacter sp. VNQ12 TaxID=3400920 RepID=UPI003C0F1D40
MVEIEARADIAEALRLRNPRERVGPLDVLKGVSPTEHRGAPSAAPPSALQAARPARDTWYEIDLQAIRHNYRQLRAQLPAGVKIFACLKRNAYGCGAGHVAEALAAEGAYGFAVASLPDAIAIRERGVVRPILLYPGPLPGSAPVIEALDLTITVSSLAELELWRAALPGLCIFVKCDLGFFRAGATPGEIGGLLASARASARVEVQGLYAHLSELPGSPPSDALTQFARLRRIVRDAEAAGTLPPIVMLSSTEGVLRYPEMDFDAVDPGALFIGMPETDSPVRQVSLRPALTAISTSLVAIKHIDASLEPVPELPGFRSGMTIGVLGMGWGDGYPRRVPPNAEVLVRNRRAPILPPAHLEHLRVDLTHVPEARFGDRALLLGRQGGEVITLEDLAAQWGTDIVGLHADLRDHIPRVYV